MVLPGKRVTFERLVSAKLPARKPVLVGAMTLQPGASPSAVGGSLRMHLVVEALDESKVIESPELPRAK